MAMKLRRLSRVIVSLLSYLQMCLRIPRFAGIAIALAIGLTALAGASLVTAQRGEPGEPPPIENFQGCVNNHTGVLRIIDAGQQCQAHETPINLDSGAGNDDVLARIEELEQLTADQQSLINDLTTANQTQQTTINELTGDIQAQQGEIDGLESRVNALETNQVTLPACLTTEAVEGQDIDDIVFNGCNVHVRDGSGNTAGFTNGLGNLIVGYDESDGDIKTGSHNLVVGPNHTYTDKGGFVAGANNAITGPYSSVSGGRLNTADGRTSSVSGGRGNTASGRVSSVSGGADNTASALFSSIGGGQRNTASGDFSSVSGGQDNIASANNASVSGGRENIASFGFSSVSGGEGNIASAYASSVSGGEDTEADGSHDWRAGDLYFTTD